MTSCLPARREEVGAPPPDRPLHHPRPGIYNAVLRSDLWALPALGTGHRLGIQNAPAGGPSQITDHITSKAREGGTFRETETRNAICLAFLNACDSAVAPLDDLAQLAELDLNAQRRDR